MADITFTVVTLFRQSGVRVFPVTPCHGYYEINEISRELEIISGESGGPKFTSMFCFGRKMVVKYLMKKEIRFFLCMWIHVVIILMCFSFSVLTSLKMCASVRRICSSNSCLIFTCVSNITFTKSY